MARTPQEVATAAREHLNQANTAFVPVNLVKSAELAVEFMEATAAALAAMADLLEANGIKPDEAQPDPAE